jgi:beta-glucosidase
MGWNVDPDAMAEQLARLRAEYPPLPIYITENGTALRDEVAPDGRVRDEPRAEYLREHIAAAERAIGEGTDLRGYFVWSLLDNFEWSFGYRPRFGLVHVDYGTQRRTPKDSAAWYAQLIRANGMP